MPKFVPVIDSEKPLCEQDHESNAKHRQFDNPFQLNKNHNKKKQVDRGWEQGNVGWGVLGSHGSNQKDNIAQIIRRTEGGNKMIKNDKGLWVKSKECENTAASVSSSSHGRGRGSGIPAFNYDSIEQSSSSDVIKERKVIHDEFDYKGPRYQDSLNEQDLNKEVQRDDDRRFSTKDREKAYDDRSKSYRDRRRSRSRSRDRNDKQYSNRNDTHYSSREMKRDNSRSERRSRYDSRDRSDFHHKNDRDKNHLDNTHHHQQHRKERIDNSNYLPSSNLNVNQSSIRDHGNDIKENVSKVTNEEDITNNEDSNSEDKCISTSSFTAIQVINRFHDVFSTNTLFHSDRIQSIQELFTEDAIIASLKTNSCYLKGKQAIQTSFEKTNAFPVEISKRLYFDNASEVTFCLDFHRPGTAPGLGDKNKHTILLYRCKSACITNIWGCVDQEQLSDNKTMLKEKILYSKIYEYVKSIILNDYVQLNNDNDINYHNYDEMEVWGM